MVHKQDSLHQVQQQVHPCPISHAACVLLQPPTTSASSVTVTQGDTVFTLMPSLAHSQLRFLASWFIAALLIAYTLPALLAVGPPATDDTITMLPAPDALSSG